MHPREPHGARRLSFARAFFTVALLLAGGLVSCSESPASRKVRINLIDSPPLEFRDDQGKNRGFAVEVFESVADSENWEIEWVEGTWPEALEQLERGEIDLLFPVLPTSERRSRFEFSRVSMFMTWGRVFANPEVKIDVLADLGGKRIAVIEEDFYGQEIENMVAKFEIDCQLEWKPSKLEVLKAVAAGECDAAAIEGFVSLGATDDYQLDVTPVIFAPGAPHVVARKGENLDLLERFDAQVAGLRAEEDGLYEQAFNKWFSLREGPKYSPGVAATAISVLLVVIVLAVATFVLRRKVNASTAKLLEIGIRSRDILENMPVMLNAIGEDGLYVVWNKECERVTGYTADEIIGNERALEMLYPDPEYRAEVLAKSDELNYDYHNWERHYTAKDGSLRHLATSSISRMFPVPGWKAWGIAVDISERKRAEESLQSSEERLRLVMDNVPVVIAHCDDQDVFTFCNARAEELLQMELKDVVGKHAPEVLGEEFWNTAEAWKKEAKQGKQTSFETRWRSPQGDRKDIGVMLVPDVASTGEVLGCYALLADITGRVSAERARRKLEEQLRHSQKMEAIGELASGVAHDFRNLLTVIAAHTDHVRKEVADSKVVLRSLDTVEEAVSQASIVTRSLLTFSKKLDTVMVPLRLQDTLKETTKLVMRTMPSAISSRVETPSDVDLWVEADPTQLQQVLLNLLLNASDAMPDGGELVVELRRDPTSDSRALIIVRDTGCGMTPEIRSRVFEPFFTTKAGERGTGLGLATVHGIIENHGGRISVESELGVGTAFFISLPLTSLRSESTRTRERRESPPGRGERILLAEHNHQVLQVLAATLREFGYDVIKARDGGQLSRNYESSKDKIRLLVVDVGLPKESAIQVVRDIRSAGERVPVVLLSTNTGPIVEDLLDDDTVLLPKPFQMTELAEVVHSLLVPQETQSGGS